MASGLIVLHDQANWWFSGFHSLFMSFAISLSLKRNQIQSIFSGHFFYLCGLRSTNIGTYPDIDNGKFQKMGYRFIGHNTFFSIIHIVNFFLNNKEKWSMVMRTEIDLGL